MNIYIQVKYWQFERITLFKPLKVAINNFIFEILRHLPIISYFKVIFAILCTRFIDKITNIEPNIIELTELVVKQVYILTFHQHISQMHVVMAEHMFCIFQYFLQLIHDILVSKTVIKTFLALIYQFWTLLHLFVVNHNQSFFELINFIFLGQSPLAHVVTNKELIIARILS